MFKTISAALLAVSVLAAPAFAASTTTKTEQAPTTKSATVIKPVHVKKHSLHAHARMHHRRHFVRHHRSHTKIVGKFHKNLKVSAKPVHPAKRG